MLLPLASLRGDTERCNELDRALPNSRCDVIDERLGGDLTDMVDSYSGTSLV